MIDLHCHILPEIDGEGPADMDEALAMAEIAVADGIRMMVATPAVGPDNPLRADQVCERTDAFNVLLQRRHIPLGVLPGAELSCLLPLDAIAAFGLAGTRYVLLSLPRRKLPNNANYIVFQLRQRGLFPIIANPELNEDIQIEPDLLLPLLKPGVHVQINGASITGELGPDIQRCVRYLLYLDKVRLLASNASASPSRPPTLREGVRAVADIVGRRKAQDMVERNPHHIVRDRLI